MNAIAVLDLSLLLIGAMMAIVMVIAWLDFDRPSHALTWSITFALLATTGAFEWGTRHGLIQPATSHVLIVTLGALAAAVNTVGFRQRAALPPRAGLLIGLAALPPIGAVLLRHRGPEYTAIAPLDLFDAVMMALAAMTLIGRRRSERTAQRIAYCGLLTLCFLSAMLFSAKAHAMVTGQVADVAWTGGAVLALLPATITGMGLVAIFLLAADQADQTRRLAATDLLTGLLNRRGFEEAATALLDAARTAGRQVSLALVDIDWFKDINDSFGHPTGDRVIARFATMLAEQSGRRDLLARVGGEEFAVLMADADLTAAACAAEVIRGTIAAAPFDLPDARRVSASFGVVAMGAEAASLRDMFSRADQALYQAKSAGRDRVIVYNKDRR